MFHLSLKDLSTVLFVLAAIGIILQLLCYVPFSKKDYFRQGSYLDVLKNIRKDSEVLGRFIYFLHYMNIGLLLAMFSLSFIK